MIKREFKAEWPGLFGVSDVTDVLSLQGFVNAGLSDCSCSERCCSEAALALKSKGSSLVWSRAHTHSAGRFLSLNLQEVRLAEERFLGIAGQLGFRE